MPSIGAVLWWIIKSAAEAGLKHEAESIVEALRDHLQLHPADWHVSPPTASFLAPQDQAYAKAHTTPAGELPAPVKEG